MASSSPPLLPMPRCRRRVPAMVPKQIWPGVAATPSVSRISFSDSTTTTCPAPAADERRLIVPGPQPRQRPSVRRREQPSRAAPSSADGTGRIFPFGADQSRRRSPGLSGKRQVGWMTQFRGSMSTTPASSTPPRFAADSGADPSCSLLDDDHANRHQARRESRGRSLE